MDEKFWMLLPVDPLRSVGMPLEEFGTLQRVFQGRISHTAAEIPAGYTVIPRYRSIPFGRELEAEVEANGSHLLNTYKQHRGVAYLPNWVNLLTGHTAPAYGVGDIPRLPADQEWFVKGETNSVKNRWFTHCYAKGTPALTEVVRNNQLDGYVGSQEIMIRPYENFRQVATAVDGRPVFNEWRVFVLDGKIISEGFYWSSFADDITEDVKAGKSPTRRQEVLKEVVPLVQDLARFIVIDLAETPEGDWRVVELNDGVMSGLSENDPATVWSSFR